MPPTRRSRPPRRSAQPVHVLVAGANAKAAAEAASKLAGVEKVLLADSAPYEHQLAEPAAALIVSLAGSYDALVAPATTTGKNVMPRVAALLDVMQVSDITKVVSPDTFERPIYAGNAIQTVQATDAKKVITVRTAAFPAAAEGGSAADRDGECGRRSGHVVLQGRGDRAIRPARADLGPDHHLGRTLARKLRELHQVHRADRRQARGGHGRFPRGGRCRLCAERLAGRPDRQGGGARSLHRGRDFRAPFSIWPA